MPDIPKPTTVKESSEAIDIQCTRVKHELGRLNELIQMHQHEEHRVHAEAIFRTARNVIDNLQEFIRSR